MAKSKVITQVEYELQRAENIRYKYVKDSERIATQLVMINDRIDILKIILNTK